jgi:serine/threonine-protein kinase
VSSAPFPGLAGGPLLGASLGIYRLLDVIGEGGMGKVYLAEHTRIGRKVALKLLRPEYAQNPTAARRFFAEARAVNQIRHDNIIAITDFFDEGTDYKYYIMELLTGRTLAEVVRSETVTLSRQLAIAGQVADALAAVHAAGIVHRDLKMDNIFLTTHGGRADFVKILDFGVAKLLDVSEGRPLSKTGVGAIIGTPEYMSPEQVSGRPVDHRSDIYSLGVILYELATRRKPLEAKSFGEMVVKHLTVTPPRPSKLKELPEPIPPPLEDLILQCLEKEAARRPESMGEVHTRLLALQSGDEDTLSHYVSSSRQARQRAMLAGAAVAGFLVVFGATGLVVYSTNGRARAVVAPPAGRPARVTVEIDSVPRGAAIVGEPGGETLGQTPHALSLERKDQVRTFRLELDGFEPVTQTVSTLEDTKVQVIFSRLPTRAAKVQSAPAKKARRVPATRRGTIDPFAE